MIFIIYKSPSLMCRRMETNQPQLCVCEEPDAGRKSGNQREIKMLESQSGKTGIGMQLHRELMCQDSFNWRRKVSVEWRSESLEEAAVPVRSGSSTRWSDEIWLGEASAAAGSSRAVLQAGGLR